MGRPAKGNKTRKRRDGVFGVAARRAARDKNVRLACGKICYATKGEAKAAVRSTLNHPSRADDKPGELMPYRCERCESWHIGRTTMMDAKHIRSLAL